jgi:hypothetical protein
MDAGDQQERTCARDGVGGEGLFGNQSNPAADKTSISDHWKCVVRDPGDPVECREIELTLRTDYLEVIDKARQPARDKHETPRPIGRPRHQHNQRLK